MQSNSRLSLWLYPELARFDTQAERQTAAMQFQRQLIKSWRMWATVIGVSIGLGTIVPLMPLWLPWLVPGLRFSIAMQVVVTTIGSILPGLILPIGLNLAIRQPFRRHLRERLAARGVPICIPCGYDLRGLTEARCPECGTPFDPALVLRPS